MNSDQKGITLFIVATFLSVAPVPNVCGDLVLVGDSYIVDREQIIVRRLPYDANNSEVTLMKIIVSISAIRQGFLNYKDESYLEKREKLVGYFESPTLNYSSPIVIETQVSFNSEGGMRLFGDLLTYLRDERNVNFSADKLKKVLGIIEDE
jgi:hypothetical protein